MRVTVVDESAVLLVGVRLGEVVEQLPRALEHLSLVVGAVGDLDGARQRLGLLLRVRDADELSVALILQRVAGGAHLPVHLEAATQRRAVERRVVAGVRPGVVRRVRRVAGVHHVARRPQPPQHRSRDEAAGHGRTERGRPRRALRNAHAHRGRGEQSTRASADRSMCRRCVRRRCSALLLLTDCCCCGRCCREPPLLSLAVWTLLCALAGAGRSRLKRARALSVPEPTRLSMATATTRGALFDRVTAARATVRTTRADNKQPLRRQRRKQESGSRTSRTRE